MASGDARLIPVKNQAWRVTFPIFDADGDLVTGAATLDSEVSKDGGTFADCTNEATEIATASGMYYLDLTATEMNADTVAIIVKTGTAGAKTTPIVVYPHEDGDIRSDVRMYGGVAGTFAGGRPEVNVSHLGGTAGTFAGGRPEVNVSHLGGTAGTFAGGRPEVNVSHLGGTAGTFAAGRPEVNLSHIAGAAVSTTTAQLGVNVVQVSGDGPAADTLESYLDGSEFMPVDAHKPVFAISGATLTVKKPDGTTTAHTKTLTTDGAALPITGAS